MARSPPTMQTPASRPPGPPQTPGLAPTVVEQSPFQYATPPSVPQQTGLVDAARDYFGSVLDRARASTRQDDLQPLTSQHFRSDVQAAIHDLRNITSDFTPGTPRSPLSADYAVRRRGTRRCSFRHSGSSIAPGRVIRSPPSAIPLQPADAAAGCAGRR